MPDRCSPPGHEALSALRMRRALPYVLPLEPIGGHCRGCWLRGGSTDKDILPRRARPGWTGTPWPGPSARQKCRPSSLIGICTAKSKFGFADLRCLEEGRAGRTARLIASCPSPREHSRGPSQLLLLDWASLEPKFFIWMLGPHIKKGGKAPLLKLGVMLWLPH